ncbi:DUF1028 domain-containing protein [Microbacterium sp. NPDC080220]|uniref:DUF1028 domain-containing protein n=1 Tax=Microbacterium sp. NPDC080220 TaxID=3161017 RepID=UPI003436FC16
MTFTLLARSGALIGGATASKSLAAGNAVLAIDPAVGVVASQAWTNRALRGRMLEALAEGSSATETVARIDDWDDGAELRQIAALPVSGRGAAYTGDGVSTWAGSRLTTDAVALGNLLVGEHVVEAMMGSFEAAASAVDAAAFARAVVDAMRAGDDAGGDARGRQSAALLVAQAGGEVVIDLRVDDHPDPLAELARLVGLRAADLDRRAHDALGGLSARRA